MCAKKDKVFFFFKFLFRLIKRLLEEIERKKERERKIEFYSYRKSSELMVFVRIIFLIKYVYI